MLFAKQLPFHKNMHFADLGSFMYRRSVWGKEHNYPWQFPVSNFLLPIGTNMMKIRETKLKGLVRCVCCLNFRSLTRDHSSTPVPMGRTFTALPSFYASEFGAKFAWSKVEQARGVY